MEKWKNKNVYMFISTITCMPLIMYLNYMGYVDVGGLTVILLLLKTARNDDTKLKNNINIDLNALAREDIEEFEKINDEITKLSDGGTKTIYINASSRIFNRSMIYSYEKSTAKSFLLPISQVDSRDGVPGRLENANYVIVTDPVKCI